MLSRLQGSTFLGYDKDDLLFGLDVMPDVVMNKVTQL